MTRNPQVIVLGSVNIDLVVRGPRLPQPGETVLGGEFFENLGGKGTNQAVAAARAGRAPVPLIAAVGDDDLGRRALRELEKENLVCSFIKTVRDTATGTALIMVDAHGENLISVASGANRHLRPEDVDRLPDELFADAQVLLCCLESPLETVERGLARARQFDVLTILNPAPAPAALCRGALWENVDVITPNETEAAALTGRDVRSEAGAVEAAQTLVQLGCRTCVVTRGGRGCVVVDADERETILPAYTVTAIDTTAAGDAFNGALAVALAEGKKLEAAADWASRAAAISVTRHGAVRSLPTRDEIESDSKRPRGRGRSG